MLILVEVKASPIKRMMKLDMENCRDDERASKMDGTCFQIKFLSNSLPFPYATKFNLSTLFEAVW